MESRTPPTVLPTQKSMSLKVHGLVTRLSGKGRDLAASPGSMARVSLGDRRSDNSKVRSADGAPVPSDTEPAQSIGYAILTWTLESTARQSPILRVSQHSPAQRYGLERSWRANWSEALAPSGRLRSIALRRTNWASRFKLTLERDVEK
jgi:hypothetical protein